MDHENTSDQCYLSEYKIICENNEQIQSINSKMKNRIDQLEKQIKERDSLLRLLNRHHQQDIDSIFQNDIFNLK